MKKFITTPRIIGAICIVIAIILYLRNAKYFSIALAGIILLVAPTKHAKELFDTFVTTFTRWKLIVITAFYDALFFLLLYGSIYFFRWRLELKAAQTQATTTLTREALLDPALASQNVTAIRSLMVLLLVGMLVLIIFNLLTYTISRGLIWTTIADKKPTKKFFLRFLGLNSLWWLIWVPLTLVVAITLKQDPAAKGSIATVLVIATYFTPILHTSFISGKRIGESIGNAFAIGISKLFRFAVPYTYAFIVYIIIFQAFKLVQQQPTKIVFSASMLFVILYIAWLRTYLYQVIKT